MPANSKSNSGRGVKVEILDGDIVRTNLSKSSRLTKENSDTNIRRIGFVADLLSRNGVICDYRGDQPLPLHPRRGSGPHRALHRGLREGAARGLESRDVKGMYAKARAGEIKGFTGIDDPYEEPENAEVVCETDKETVDQSVAKIVAELERRGHIPAAVST